VKAVLESLRFPTITERYEAIAEAHKKAFEWIFQPMVDEEIPNGVQWNDFVEWLREGQGIYWINGKAASGKSTLMKFIYDNPKTRENLVHWGGGKLLHVAKFFFWWAGTKIQKSQDGLLRSPLYEILRQMPQVTPFVLPTEYAMTFAREAFISESPRVSSTLSPPPT
jgi:predicted ATPase